MEYISEPSKEGLLASIEPGMKLTKGFLKRTYGYSITDPSLPDKAISALDAGGCSKAWTYYEEWVAKYQAAHDEDMRETAKWYRKECERAFENMKKGSEEQRKQKQQMQEQKSRVQQWKELSQLLDFQSMKKGK